MAPEATGAYDRFETIELFVVDCRQPIPKNLYDLAIGIDAQDDRNTIRVTVASIVWRRGIWHVGNGRR